MRKSVNTHRAVKIVGRLFQLSKFRFGYDWVCTLPVNPTVTEITQKSKLVAFNRFRPFAAGKSNRSRV